MMKYFGVGPNLIQPEMCKVFEFQPPPKRVRGGGDHPTLDGYINCQMCNYIWNSWTVTQQLGLSPSCQKQVSHSEVNN